MKTAMIPARLGSQRLPRKNLQEIEGSPLIAWAIRRCQRAGCFDEIWVNAEAAEIAEREGAKFHRRPAQLAENDATSEQYIHQFLQNHECEFLFQVHCTAPLLLHKDIRHFVWAMAASDRDVFLGCVLEQVECAMNGEPVNFTFAEKADAQELTPIQRVTWALTGWRAASFLKAVDAGQAPTYAGKVGFYPLDRLSSHLIQTEEDLDFARALWSFRHEKKD